MLLPAKPIAQQSRCLSAVPDLGGVRRRYARSVIVGIFNILFGRPSLPDRALMMASDIYRASDTAGILSELRAEFPSESANAVQDAYQQARDLLRSACAICDEYRNGAYSGDAAKTRIREGFPGFPARSYGRAFAYGMQATR
jgi:hypothetical protein